MENQPAATGRQWLRLATLARLEAIGQFPAPTTPATAYPAQAPAQRNPLPQPTTLAPLKQAQTQPPRPPNTTTNAAPAPPPQATSLASNSTKPPPPSPRFGVPSQSPIPSESPRVIKPTNPQESPRIRQLSPIKAPPPQNPEAEPKQLAAAPSPKSMFMQRQVNNSDGGSIKTITDINRKTNSMHMPQGNHNGGVETIADINGKTTVNGNQSKIKDARAPPPSSPKRETTKNGIGMTTTQKKDDHNGEMKVITMAGENVGAYMDLVSPHGHQHHIIKKQQQQHGYHQTKVGGESQSKDGKPEEDKKKEKGKKSVAAEGKPMESLVNSNVQSVNNSILFGTSYAQQSPGVHISLISRRQPKHKETM